MPFLHLRKTSASSQRPVFASSRLHRDRKLRKIDQSSLNSQQWYLIISGEGGSIYAQNKGFVFRFSNPGSLGGQPQSSETSNRQPTTSSTNSRSSSADERMQQSQSLRKTSDPFRYLHWTKVHYWPQTSEILGLRLNFLSYLLFKLTRYGAFQGRL